MKNKTLSGVLLKLTSVCFLLFMNIYGCERKNYKTNVENDDVQIEVKLKAAKS